MDSGIGANTKSWQRLKCVLAVAGTWVLVCLSSASAQTTPKISLQQPVTPPESSAGVRSTSVPAASDEDVSLEDDLDDLDSLLDADLETLRDTRVSAPDMNMEITSVARTEVAVGRTPAAVFVVTNEMIQRSGAYTLPDVLRMVPGLQVARASNGQWSIGMRGYGGIYGDSLLVQVDGRSIYTPSFSGVLWQVRDMPLTDIERIEVIRGPGASVWGANAVHGVINIVTKHTRDTIGTLTEAGAGNELRHQATIRHGAKSGPRSTWRVWGRSVEEDGGLLGNRADESGSWHASQVGFRVDRPSDYFDQNMWTGGLVTSGLDNVAERPSPVGPNFALPVQSEDEYLNWYLQSRQMRDLGGGDSFEVHSWVDMVEQDSLELIHYRLLVADVGFQHHLSADATHDIVWGGNYRLNYVDIVEDSFQIEGPGHGHFNQISLFLQDTITLHDDVALTLGTKASWNDQTQFEFQPTARIVWSPTPQYSVWGSVSRAVRLPSFLDSTVNLRSPLQTLNPLPTFGLTPANPDIDVETLVAFEGGIRGQPTRDLFWDLALFYFHSDDFISSVRNGMTVITNPPGYVDVLAPSVNRREGEEVYGFEYAMRRTMSQRWSLSGNLSVTLTEGRNQLDRYPHSMIWFQSSHDLTEAVQCDLIWRFVDLIRSRGGVPAYNEMDVRLAWKLSDQCQLELVGRNLLNEAHLEEVPESSLRNQTTLTERSVLGMIRINY